MDSAFKARRLKRAIAMKTHAEILAELDRAIPRELIEKYSHLSLAQRAEQEALAPWKQQ
jgi:hypothetical protein